MTREQSLAALREQLKPGDTISTIVRHRSRSGRSRSISLLIPDGDGSLCDIDGMAARALGLPFDRKHGGVRVSDCDGRQLVFDLSFALFAGDEAGGYALKHKDL